MRCPACQSTAVRERPERTAQGYRRFRCLDCTKQFNERSTGLLNRTQYPSDVIALVVPWRLRYKLSLRDLAEMFLIRDLVARSGRLAGRSLQVRRAAPPNVGSASCPSKRTRIGGTISRSSGTRSRIGRSMTLPCANVGA